VGGLELYGREQSAERGGLPSHDEEADDDVHNKDNTYPILYDF
jgi:hypothetical protein